MGKRLTNRSAKVFHQNFGLFDFRRVDLRRHHRHEGDLVAQVLCNGHGDGGLASARLAGEENGPACHLLLLHQLNHDAGRLASLLLPDEAECLVHSFSIFVQAQTFDVRMSGDPRFQRTVGFLQPRLPEIKLTFAPAPEIRTR